MAKRTLGAFVLAWSSFEAGVVFPTAPIWLIAILFVVSVNGICMCLGFENSQVREEGGNAK